jgi:beta-N-acetylhexosaminidase
MSRRAVVAALVLGLAAATLTAAAAGPSAAPSPTPTLRELVGQLMLVRMRGREPSQSFLARIRRGEIGGVVLFGDNFGADGPGGLVRALQQAAAGAHRPPLLIAIDQEGGIVKRLPGAPSLAPPQMRTAATAEAQGLATARNLKRFGIDVDLAPVLDVGRGGFITPRTFGDRPAEVAVRGVAFADGLARGHVAAAAKHFPGLGYATLNTDTSVEPVRATRARLLADLKPFRAAVEAGIPMVMVASAEYPALAPGLPAVCSAAVVRDLLRRSLGFDGVVVTDALKTPSINHFFSTPEAARRALAAGADLILAAGPTPTLADTDAVSTSTYRALVDAAASGRLSPTTIRAAYQRVIALKKQLG